MTIPSRTEACSLLLGLRPSTKLARHMAVVGEVAASLALRMERRGIRVDRHLVEAAAVLHDLDKALPAEDPLRALGHGTAGARWLSDRGYEELGPSVALHPVMRLGDPGQTEQILHGDSMEVRIVAYADKRVVQQVTPMDGRFARWERRHAEYRDALERARRNAERLEQMVCEAAGLAPKDVTRLRWVAPAMERARTARRG
jgi:predicted hydrolase (HD superfamily)